MTILNLQGIARTLLVPLACRALESPRPDAILHDPRAVEVYKALGGNPDFLMGMGGTDVFVATMRARQFDLFSRDFLGRNPGGLVVDIGCGLDTRFDRLDDGQMTWLGVDLPEVIELRRKVLQDGERCKTIPQSMLEISWLDEVARINKPVIFLAEGVFPYFSTADVKPLVMAMASRFLAGELVFDAASPFIARHHNRTSSVLKRSGTRILRNWKPGGCACSTTGITSTSPNRAYASSAGCALSLSWQKQPAFSITAWDSSYENDQLKESIFHVTYRVIILKREV
jgi:O-methyltransferase involved in polyketide biosynthesis